MDATETLSERIAGYIVEEKLANVDKQSIARAKQRLTYHLGLAFRGIKASEPDIERALAVARDLSDGAGKSSIIGQPDKLTVANAVFANCQMMRAFGFDDVIFETGVHPGLVTLPVSLALSERHRASGADLITSIIVGYEMMGKFARWSWTLDAPRRATMPFGPFGSIAAAAKILRLDRAQCAVALAYAAHTAMGVAEGNAGPISHYYGLVCQNGVTGAYLAKAGAFASPTTLEGEFGFYETFLGGTNIDQDAIVESFGKEYAIMTSAEKHYPGTGLNQVPIEQMRDLVLNEGLRPTDIECIDITFPSERKNFRVSYEKGPFTARTSISSALFQMAILLLDGDLKPERYEQVDNREIHALLQKMNVTLIDGQSVRYSKLKVTTADGRRLEREGDSFDYEPESPATIMKRDAAGVLPDENIDRYLDLLDRLEELDDASSLVASLSL